MGAFGSIPPPMAPFQVRLMWRCVYCRNKVQSTYEKCPHCGAPKIEEVKDVKQN